MHCPVVSAFLPSVIKAVPLHSRSAIESQRMSLSDIKAIDASGCSPVRFTPAIGVMSGAHYRMSADILHPHSLTKLVGALIKKDFKRWPAEILTMNFYLLIFHAYNA